jgi:hypothetical protein
LALREIYGEVIGKSLKPGARKEILIIDQGRIHGNGSCSPETCHSGRVKSVDNLELPKPRVPDLLLTVNLNPRSILSHTISDIVILAQKSARKDLAHGFEPWSLGKVV